MKKASLETPLQADLEDDVDKFRRQVESGFRIQQYRSVAILIVSIIIYLAVGVVFFSHFEQWSVGSSLYFCIVTLGTVGYGGEGLEPTQPGTRVFTIFYIYVGIFLIVSRAGTLVDEIATDTRATLNAIAEYEAFSSGALKGRKTLLRRMSSYGTTRQVSAADIREPPTAFAYYGLNALFATALLWSWVFGSAFIFCWTEKWNLSYIDAVYFAWSAQPTALSCLSRPLR